MDAAAARLTRARRRLGGEGSGRTYRSVSDEADVREFRRDEAFDCAFCWLEAHAGHRNRSHHAAICVVAALMCTQICVRRKTKMVAAHIDRLAAWGVAGRVREHGCRVDVLVFASGIIRMAMRRMSFSTLRRRRAVMRRPAKKHRRRRVSLNGNGQHRQVQHHSFEKT